MSNIMGYVAILGIAAVAAIPVGVILFIGRAKGRQRVAQGGAAVPAASAHGSSRSTVPTLLWVVAFLTVAGGLVAAVPWMSAGDWPMVAVLIAATAATALLVVGVAKALRNTEVILDAIRPPE